MTKSYMFWKLLVRSFAIRKSRIAIAMLAVVIGTAVISGLLNVYYDIGAKMRKEFRSYGANLLLTPAAESGETAFPQSRAERIAGEFPPADLVGYTPYLYGLAEVYTRKLVVVGTWFDQIPKITPYWEITGVIPAGRDVQGVALVGKAVSDKTGYKAGSVIPLKDAGGNREFKVTVQGVISSGGTEDNQIFISLGDAQRLFGQESLANAAYFSITGDGLAEKAAVLQAEYPELELQPIKQISNSEGLILQKIRALVYIVVAIILLSTLLCTGITMMTMVMERKAEIALKKVLGARHRALFLEFLCEGGLLALAGTLVGLGLGFILAQVIGQNVFESSISFRWATVPSVLLVSLLVAGLAALIPLRAVTRIEPAVVLKGE